MLSQFISRYRHAIITRARQKLTDRPLPLVSTSELEFGIPLFLTQLTDSLDAMTSQGPMQERIGSTAVQHARELRALGYNISQVVHDYGDICQAITEEAIAREVPISTQEFHTLNRCLDTAIADAVTEHGRLTTESRVEEETERSGQRSHELRDNLNTALLAFHALRRGTVAINGSTGSLLGRSLITLRDLVDTSLTEVRISANIQQSLRVPVGVLLHEVAGVGRLHAEYRALSFVVEPVDPTLMIEVDPQLLTSAMMNLLTNAFKFTPVGGTVNLRASREGEQVRIEIEDECGGLAAEAEDLFTAFGERRNNDRSGLGLGLSIANKAVRLHGGTINVRNIPDKGCIFQIVLPLAPAMRPQQAETRV